MEIHCKRNLQENEVKNVFLDSSVRFALKYTILIILHSTKVCRRANIKL